MRRRPWQIAAGLALYAALGGFTRANRFARLPRGDWGGLDGLETRGLDSVFRYYDAQTDDAALTRAVMHSAQAFGAELRVPAEFTAARRIDGGWSIDYTDGRVAASCTARAMINAGGPWANDVLARILPRPPLRAMELVQGTHIVLDAPSPAGIYYVEAHDGRAVFVMPWQRRTLVGTTEVTFNGDPANVAPTAQEIDYLQKTYGDNFPRREARVVESFAGLRVLPMASDSPFHRSRETLFHADDPRHPQLITVYGGKLTGYRHAAQRALRCLRAALPERRARADTATLTL
jgi:glycerol-3-phosphate dehydrogenase